MNLRKRKIKKLKAEPKKKIKKKINTKRLEDYYEDPKNPGAFSGLNSLFLSLREKNKNLDKEFLKEWLKDQEVYTLHKPKIKKFERNKIESPGIDNTFQADLIDLTKISPENNGYNFILTVIDVFSKYAWAIPLKDKTALSVLTAFKTIFEERSPLRLHTDEGKEFLNKNLKDYLKKMNIKHFVIYSEMKAAVVERFNRTLKEKMWRYFTYQKTKRYIDILPDLLSSYNNTYHRSIKMKPTEVDEKNEDQVWFNLYGEMPKQKKLKFNIGDKVRISKDKGLFDKGYTSNWKKELFVIKDIIYYNIPVYKLMDLMNEEINGVFYEEELQKVSNTKNIYDIDKILKTKTVKGEKQYFISWDGYPEKFNSWVPASSLNLDENKKNFPLDKK